MDVFFCDLCGARVTDADLRAGQGQRSRWDVICANCLEQGLGKEWLGKRSSGRKAAVGAADPGDRVATIDAEPPSAVAAAAEPEPEPVAEVTAKPKVSAPPAADLAAVLPPAPFGFDDPDVAHEDDDDNASDDHVATTDEAEPLNATAKVEAPVHDHSSSMAGAASAFSALGAGPAMTPGDGEDDDLVDRAYATPAEQLTPAGVPALGESPFGAQARLGNPEKDETALVPTLPGTEKADLDLAEAKKPGSSTSSRRKSARSGTSSRIAKSSSKGASSSKGKTSRKAVVRGKDHSSTILMVGIGLLVIIGALFGVVVVSKKSGGSSGADNPEVATEQIRNAINRGKDQAIAALRGDDLNAMIAAKDALQAAQQKIYTFEDEMKKQGNPQDRIDGYLDSLRASDTMMLLRNLNDEIIKRQNQNR